MARLEGGNSMKKTFKNGKKVKNLEIDIYPTFITPKKIKKLLFRSFEN